MAHAHGSPRSKLRSLLLRRWLRLRSCWLLTCLRAMFLESDVDVQRALIDMLCTVVILPTRQGRPAGWKPGQPYASADGVKFVWKDLTKHEQLSA